MTYRSPYSSSMAFRSSTHVQVIVFVILAGPCSSVLSSLLNVCHFATVSWITMHTVIDLLQRQWRRWTRSTVWDRSVWRWLRATVRWTSRPQYRCRPSTPNGSRRGCTRTRRRSQVPHSTRVWGSSGRPRRRLRLLRSRVRSSSSHWYVQRFLSICCNLRTILVHCVTMNFMSWDTISSAQQNRSLKACGLSTGTKLILYPCIHAYGNGRSRRVIAHDRGRIRQVVLYWQYNCD